MSSQGEGGELTGGIVLQVVVPGGEQKANKWLSPTGCSPRGEGGELTGGSVLQVVVPGGGQGANRWLSPTGSSPRWAAES